MLIQTTIAAIMSAALKHFYPRERMESPKKQTMYCYTEGPMYFLGQRIVRRMQDAGYPAKITECYRKPDRQQKLKEQGYSKAGAFQSPHAFYLAIDIVHPRLGWNVSEEYWETLNQVVQSVSKAYGVKLTHGHKWKFKDSAHVQITNWRVLAADVMGSETPSTAIAKIKRGEKTYEDFRPSTECLGEWFNRLMPDLWKRKYGNLNIEKYEQSRLKAMTNQFKAMAGL